MTTINLLDSRDVHPVCRFPKISSTFPQNFGKISKFKDLTKYTDGCIEWQVNYGYQKFYIYLIFIFSTSSIFIFFTSIPISHFAKSHTYNSIFGNTKIKNQSIQCIYCQFNYHTTVVEHSYLNKTEKQLKISISCPLKGLFSFKLQIIQNHTSQIHN